MVKKKVHFNRKNDHLWPKKKVHFNRKMTIYGQKKNYTLIEKWPSMVIFLLKSTFFFFDTSLFSKYGFYFGPK